MTRPWHRRKRSPPVDLDGYSLRLYRLSNIEPYQLSLSAMFPELLNENMRTISASWLRLS